MARNALRINMLCKYVRRETWGKAENRRKSPISGGDTTNVSTMSGNVLKYANKCARDAI